MIAATSPEAVTARSFIESELLPSGIHEPTPAVRKYLRRETDIPSSDFRQNPSQGRIAAGRLVRI